MKLKITVKKRSESGSEEKMTIIGDSDCAADVVGNLALEMEREANASGRIRVWVEEDK